jgi:glycosyltransferase involved in cell wall biosynthesis
MKMRRENPKKKLILIKSPHPDNKRKSRYGDLYLSTDLAEGINNHGEFISVVAPRHYWNRFFINMISDYFIVFRGLHNLKLSKKQMKTHFMYFISHPERTSLEEFNSYKAVIVASEKHYKTLKDSNVNAFYVPQFTNMDKFYYIKDDTKKHDVLFIGNSRGVYRETVKYCINNGIDVAVYGKGWENVIPKKFIKSRFVKNDELNRYYSNAKIVLNDHWEFMKKNGFMANRVFDVAACKGFMISDYISDIESIFKGNIETYKDEEDFVKKIIYYLDNDKERIKKAEKAYEITSNKFTKESIAKSFVDIIKKSS